MHNTATERPPLTIRPRANTWSSLRAQTGLDTDAALAAQLNVTERTLRNVFTGDTDPSPRFIAHALAAFPFAGFRELFRVAEA